MKLIFFFYRLFLERVETLQLARLGKVEVVLTTFDTARVSLEQLNKIHWDLVIVDEVHKLKEVKAKITVALKQLKCKRRIGLTGMDLPFI